MKTMTWCLTIAGAALALTTGCNDTPIEGLEKSTTIIVTKDAGSADPVKIDFLWVVDNSSSMCEEQVGLTDSFNEFTDSLGVVFDIDPRLAVTTHDAQCEIDNEKVFSSKGVFNQRPAETFPPPCHEALIHPCFTHEECAGLDCRVRCDGIADDADRATCNAECAAGPQGEWTCKKPQTETCVTNPNGSINSRCRRGCTTDEECQELFGDSRSVCHQPSTSQVDWGCLLPPSTAGCPAEVPPILDGTNSDLFPCAATVGVNQEKCLKYEQGMRSALMAVDPTGPNAAQSREFLRDDAYLVIIFISDEDDCSVVDGETLHEDFHETCALQPTTEEGGKLVPVGHYVNRFKSLKSDPGRVIVATIVGDSLATDDSDKDFDRNEYVASKGHERKCHQGSYICESPDGKADWGARYTALSKAFGPNGVTSNICGTGGIGPALQTVAETIIGVVNKICLPKPILGETLTVTRQRGDTTVELELNGEGANGYQRVDFVEDCVDADGSFLPALFINDPPVPGEKITIDYQGDPQFD